MRARDADRDDFLGNFHAWLDCEWAIEGSPLRRLLDEAITDVVLDPRLGQRRPGRALLVTVAGGATARRLARAVPQVTVFDPSGLTYAELPASRAADRGILWVQGPSLADLPDLQYDAVVVDHLAMVLRADEVREFVRDVRRLLVPDGLLALVNACHALPGWEHEAASLGAAVSDLVGAPVHEHHLGEEQIEVWRP